MPNLWTLGGLPLFELLRRTARESWEDSVFGQGGRMAFYQFLALFPALAVSLAIAAHIPGLGGHLKSLLQDLWGQVFPDQVSQSLQRTIQELQAHQLSEMQFVFVSAGAVWAAFNSTWAMIYGLNRAYEVEERRSRRELALTNAGLTLSMAAMGCTAVLLILGGGWFQAQFPGGAVAARCVEWLVLTGLVCLLFAVLYRFAPNVPDHEWRWSTPGALCAFILWIGSSFAARVYFDRVNNYSRSYGHLNGVAILLLWLYATNGAILIGGEMNSEIEKAAGRRNPLGGAHRNRTPSRPG